MGFTRLLATTLAPYPRLFFPLVRAFAPDKFDGHLVGRDAEVVISGYPRSANSFAVMAFYQAQQRDVTIASHLHVEAEVFEAVRLGLPTIVLVRRPEDAIASFKAAEPAIDPNRELRRWIAYYSRVEPLRDHFVVSDFARTTGDFGSAIDELNARFGTSFRRFEATEENCARVFEAVRSGQAVMGTERFTGMPGEAGKSGSRDVELRFDPRLLARATAIYARFRAFSNGVSARSAA